MKQVENSNWWRSSTVRTVVIVLAVIAVIALVFFSEQIGDLFEFFGSKAAIEQQPGNVTLLESEEGSIPQFEPLDLGDFEGTQFDATTNRIILAPPTGQIVIDIAFKWCGEIEVDGDSFAWRWRGASA